MQLKVEGVADATAIDDRVSDLEMRVAKLEGGAPVDPPRPVDPSLPEDTIPAADVNQMLAKGGTIKLPSATILGTLIVSAPETKVLGDSVSRTKIVPERNLDAVTVTANHIEFLELWHLYGASMFRDQGRGIYLGLSSQDDEYAKRVVIGHCRMDDFDTSYQFVDSFARFQPLGTPGRIGLTFDSNIANKSYGDDNHSIGLYVEGLAEGAVIARNVFDKSGWLEQQDRNKRSHCIYAQSFGAPIEKCFGNVFSRAAANAAQFRAGCRHFHDNIISECSLGPWFDAVSARVENNVVLDQADIQPPDNDPSTPDPDIRGHGFIFSHDGHSVNGNLLARQNGSQDKVPAVKGLWGTAENNVVADWHQDGLNYEINGRLYSGIFTNRTLNSDPGIPRFTDIDKWINRKPGEPVPDTRDFIESCWKAIQ